MQEKEQQAVVAYIFRCDGKLLSVTRKDTGQHSAPGGKVELGEPRLIALQREVEEETGLLLDLRDFTRVYEGMHTSGRRVFAYLVTRWTGEPVAREPGTTVAWVDPIEIAFGFGSEYHSVALRASNIWNPSYWIEIPNWQGVRGYVFGVVAGPYNDEVHAKEVYDSYVVRRHSAVSGDAKSSVRLMCGSKENARVLLQFNGNQEGAG